MKLIDILGLKNFRVFDEKSGFLENFSSINIFAGTNSSGKSSVIKSLQMLRNSVIDGQPVFDLDLSQQEHLLGDFDNVLHNNKNKNLETSIPFTFMGLSNLYVSLCFEAQEAPNNYRAKLRSIKVIDSNDDNILFSFFYREANSSEVKIDLENYKKRREEEKEKAKGKIVGLEEDSILLSAFFHNYYSPLRGYIEYEINMGKLKKVFSDLKGFYKGYLDKKGEYRLLEKIDEIADDQSMPFVPSLLIRSFRSDVSIDDWENFSKSLANEIVSNKWPAREDDFQREDFAPDAEIGEVLYNKSLEILGKTFTWSSNDRKKSEYNVIENCFKSAWQSFIQRILTINYLSTVKEENSRIYNTASNSPFVNLLKDYHRYQLQDFDFLNKYLQKFDIGKKIIVDFEPKYNLISVSIANSNNSNRELVDFGYGIKQLILILIQISVLAKKNGVTREDDDDEYGLVEKEYYHPSLLIIEEPEANLHPKWQSLLAELFTEANKQFKIQFVIETHSEYLIRKFQTLVAENKIDGNKIKIFYLRNLHNAGSNVQQMSSMNIASDGLIDYKVFDSGFFDEADKLELSLLNFQRNSFIDDFEALKIEQGENESKIVELETKIDEFTAKFDTQVYEREAALLFDVSKLETKTVEYLISGLLVFALSKDGNDFSPVMLQFGRAVEYELKQMFVNILAEKKRTIGGMQQHFERYVNYQGEYTAGDNTTHLENELNNRFRNPRNLRVDLLEDLRVGRNDAAHSGSSHDRQDALNYINVVKEFLGNFTSEKNIG